MEEVMDSIKKVNVHFDAFVKSIKEVRESVREEDEFTRGYLECMKEVIEASVSGEFSGWLETIEKRSDMRYRGDVIDEIMEGLDHLLEAYKAREE
jgi:hypothetical protein